MERYGVHHPVLDDPDLTTWSAYTARAWPTLVLVDPEGYIVAQYAGEGHAHALDRLLEEQVAHHRAAGTLQPGDSPYVPPVVEPSELRFPASAVPLPDGRVLVADAGHDEVVLLDAEGRRQEPFAGFREPNGLCLLPTDVADEVGYDVVVADTAGHRLAGLTLATGETQTLCGDGRQWMPGDGTAQLSSPWDVAWWQDRVWVAMAGIHQLWTFEPRSGAVEVTAETANEGLLDGPLAEAWFAQPSGLAADGDRLWLVDSETSALRWVEAGHVHTVVGTGLFDFGFRDGPASSALLQHPLGVSVLLDGSVAVADTYNGAIRRYADGKLTTIATGLSEPSAAYVDSGQLVVVESAAHRLTWVPLDARVAADDFAHGTQRPVVDVATVVDLDVSFAPPPGQKVVDRFGPPSQLLVSATPPALLRGGEGRGTDLTRRLVLDAAVGDGVLHVAARAASCDIDGGRLGGESGAEGAACHLHQLDWGVPVRVTAEGSAVLVLPLGGRA